LIPGETSVIFLEQAAKQLELDKNTLLAEFEKQATYKEGVFLPASTHFLESKAENAWLKEVKGGFKEWFKNFTPDPKLLYKASEFI
ncbi:hypothetical protein VWM83_09215, partial [Campylobacter coli]